jgi:hypothetical protein
MAKYRYVVLSNCVPGTDEAFNKWYREVHLPQFLQTPDVVSATRYELAEYQITERDGSVVVVPSDHAGMPYRYLAIYSIDTDDISGVLNNAASRFNDGKIIMSPTFSNALSLSFKVLE